MMRDLKRKLLLAFFPVPTHATAAPAPRSPAPNKAYPLLSPHKCTMPSHVLKTSVHNTQRR